MSLQKSRYESQNIVNSYNLFIDSGKAAVVGDGQSTGDNYLVHLGDNAIMAEDGEIIRLSLVNFNMFNNVYMVNLNNCKFRVTTNIGATVRATEVNIPRKNYKTIGAMASAFGAALSGAILAQVQAAGSTATTTTDTILPDPNTALNATDDRLVSVSMVFDNAHGIGAGELFVQCFREVGDSFALLGADGIDAGSTGNNTTDNSFKITVVNATTILVEGFYPAQRMTDPNIYVRVQSHSNGIESIVLSDPIGNSATGRYEGEITNSNILGVVRRDTEFISFETGSSDEFFVNLQQRKLTSLRVFLTDSRNRPLGRPFNSPTLGEGTASGLENSGTGVVESKKQNQTGNLFFDAVIKVEIIKVRNPQLLDTMPPPPPLPAREAQSVLTWQNYGRPKF